MQDVSDRQDLFQEIAMALWTALPRFRAAASERTWLYRIAHNVALTYSSKRRRQHRSEQPLEATMRDPEPLLEAGGPSSADAAVPQAADVAGRRVSGSAL
jgi:RNA polymerase sigma factor (sigma-70 family)